MRARKAPPAARVAAVELAERILRAAPPDSEIAQVVRELLPYLRADARAAPRA